MSKDNKEVKDDEIVNIMDVDSLSVKQFGDDKERRAFLGEKPKQGFKVAIGTVSGTVVKLKTYTNRMNGESQTTFIGKFGLVNMDGERYTSGKLYLPTQPAGELERLYLTGGSNPMDFKMDVEIVADASSPADFRYIAVVKSNVKEIDPFNVNL